MWIGTGFLMLILLTGIFGFSFDGNIIKKFKISPAKEFGDQGKLFSQGDNDVTSSTSFMYSSPYWNNFEGNTLGLDAKMFNPDELFHDGGCQEKRDTCNKNEHYRRINGFCNNKRYPSYGASNEVLSRLLPPAYDKGVMRIMSKNGDLLPNPRVVSTYMKLMRRRMATEDINVLWLFFGQFIDHDFVFTPTSLEGRDQSICSVCDSWRITSACAPILVPKTDEFLVPFTPDNKRKCLNFVRSSAVPSKYDENGEALEQFNSNTAYLDLSPVYGSTSCKENNLRLYHYGQLREQRHPLTSEGMLPMESASPFKDCRGPMRKCPEAGDGRPVETLAFHLIHLIFLREHNRIAKKLYTLNKHWSDELIYQEARRINIAQYQNIIYDEFLPLMLGERIMKLYGLQTFKGQAYYEGYDSEINPNVLTEFATAAFRVGHTMVPDNIYLMDDFYVPKESMETRTLFRNSTYVYKKSLFDDVARGLIASKIEAVDPVIESSIQDNLFIKKLDPFTSQDLISLNIARGRDHGITGYASYYNLCESRPIKSWEDLPMHKDDIEILKRVYSSVHDIDLFVGGLAEVSLDGLVGPTFGCIIAQQFLRSKKGDLFWFENKHNHLTPNQLDSISESATLGKIVAMNLNGVSYLPKLIFKVPDERNPLLPTHPLQDIDINLWRDYKQEHSYRCQYNGKYYDPEQYISVSPCLRCHCSYVKERITCTKSLHECGKYGKLDGYCKILCQFAG